MIVREDQIAALESHEVTMEQPQEQLTDCQHQSIPGLMVAIFGMDSESKPFFQHALAKDFSRRSALLEGVEYRLKPGEIVGIQHKKHRARARVLWVCEIGETRQYKVSIHLVAAEDCPWEDIESNANSFSARKRGRERRREPRAAVVVGVDLSKKPQGGIIRTHSSDLSPNGCYLETAWPLSIGTEVSLAMWLEGTRVNATAIVRTSHPGTGMGLEFTGLTPEEQERVKEFLQCPKT
jgi:hypothetical protein